MAEKLEAEGAAYRWALRANAVTVGVIAVVGVTVAASLRGGHGALGAVLGAALGGLSGLVTPAAMMIGYRKKPEVLASIVAGSWLAKMIVVVAGLALLGGVESLHRVSFAAVVFACVVGTLVVDVLAVRKARIPYVDSGSAGPTS